AADSLSTPLGSRICGGGGGGGGGVGATGTESRRDDTRLSILLTERNAGCTSGRMVFSGFFLTVVLPFCCDDDDTVISPVEGSIKRVVPGEDGEGMLIWVVCEEYEAV